VTSGYEGPDYTPGEDKKVKPPEDCTWSITQKNVGDSEEADTIYAAFECDGEVLGMVRLPNPEYLRWLRERIQG
jgi:hypothetical protein